MSDPNRVLHAMWDSLDMGFESLGDDAFTAYVEATYAGDKGEPLFDELDAQDIRRLREMLAEGEAIVHDALKRKGKL